MAEAIQGLNKKQADKVEAMQIAYQDRIANQVKSIDRLLAERTTLKAELSERSERVRELEDLLAKASENKEEE